MFLKDLLRLAGKLLGIQLDDELLLDRQSHILPGG
jgi:hypothetical protein